MSAAPPYDAPPGGGGGGNGDDAGEHDQRGHGHPEAAGCQGEVEHGGPYGPVVPGVVVTSLSHWGGFVTITTSATLVDHGTVTKHCSPR